MHTDISQPFSHTCKPKHTRKEKKEKNDVSLRVSDIFVYVHDIYACYFLLSAYCSCRHLFFKIKKKKKKVEGRLRGPASHLSLAEQK